jgi:hypothetical protein
MNVQYSLLSQSNCFFAEIFHKSLNSTTLSQTTQKNSRMKSDRKFFCQNSKEKLNQPEKNYFLIEFIDEFAFFQSIEQHVEKFSTFSFH